MIDKHFTVAIDGPSGAGKTTIAQAVAHRTGALYLDTGAMYRTVGLAALQAGIPFEEEEKIIALTQGLHIDVRHQDGQQHIYLNGQDVSGHIREPQVSMAASRVSAIAQVRALLVDMQREIARGKSVVMDGRDIGTHVLPQATVKIFLTADARERARRRCLQLQQAGNPVDFEEIYRQQLERDYNDTHRAASPLEKARDAVEMDTTGMTLEETINQIMNILSGRLEDETP